MALYRSKAFIDLRTQLVQTQQALDEAKKRYDELQSKVMDSDRELLAARAKLSAAQKGGIEAIDELTNTDKLISESLRAELDRLRENYNFVVVERDAQKSQLIEALLAKDRLRKEVEDVKELQENSTSGPADANMSEAMKKSTEKIEKLRTRLKERKQVRLINSSPAPTWLLSLGLVQAVSGWHQTKTIQTKQSNLAIAVDLTNKYYMSCFPCQENHTRYWRIVMI